MKKAIQSTTARRTLAVEKSDGRGKVGGGLGLFNLGTNEIGEGATSQ